jgi:hypothetical protein
MLFFRGAIDTKMIYNFDKQSKFINILKENFDQNNEQVKSLLNFYEFEKELYELFKDSDRLAVIYDSKVVHSKAENSNDFYNISSLKSKILSKRISEVGNILTYNPSIAVFTSGLGAFFSVSPILSTRYNDSKDGILLEGTLNFDVFIFESCDEPHNNKWMLDPPVSGLSGYKIIGEGSGSNLNYAKVFENLNISDEFDCKLKELLVKYIDIRRQLSE